MYKHYSPRASIKIIQDLDILRQYSKIDEKKIALILTNEFITENKNILSNLSENFQIISW
jgi:hypothetical protein